MLKGFGKLISPFLKSAALPQSSNYSVLSSKSFSTWKNSFTSTLKPTLNVNPTSIFQNASVKPLLASNNQNVDQTRNVTKFSLKTGKKKSVSAVLRRFYRLNNGLWIRRRGGCHSGLHKKSPQTRYNLEQHVVCTKRQCMILDKMTTDYVKKRRYFIDDPFEPYHERNDFDWVKPYRKT